MFGRRKMDIHEQAMAIMHHWDDVLNEADLTVEFDTEDEVERNRDYLILHISLLGMFAYYVAALKHTEVAQEMIDIFKRMLPQFDSEANPTNISVEDAENMITIAIQEANDIVESCVNDGKDIDAVIDEQAQLIIDDVGLKDTETNLEFFKNVLSIFSNTAFEFFSKKREF